MCPMRPEAPATATRNCDDVPPPKGAYSRGIRAGDFLYVSGQVPLAEGSNVLTARAEDQAGNAAEATRPVVRDSQAPVIAITDPAPGTNVPAPIVMLLP